MSAENKHQLLKEYLHSLGSVAVAFSSGVDSTYLLKTAHDVLGDMAIALTLESCIFPQRELTEAVHFCRNEGIRHIICRTDPLAIKGFCQNPSDRCYLCKTELFTKLKAIASENGIKYVAEGSNVDDLGDYRPGLRAVAELGIKSPLREAGLTKSEIRLLSKELGLSTWGKPSYACLASRFAYGEIITEEKLSMVEKGEQFLRDNGFHQMRVRIHGDAARIEILPDDFQKLIIIHSQTVSAFKSYGFTYVSMDLQGYRTGSMNETLDIDRNI